jgi:hypothetical protein
MGNEENYSTDEKKKSRTAEAFTELNNKTCKQLNKTSREKWGE